MWNAFVAWVLGMLGASPDDDGPSGGIQPDSLGDGTDE